MKVKPVVLNAFIKIIAIGILMYWYCISVLDIDITGIIVTLNIEMKKTWYNK